MRGIFGCAGPQTGTPTRAVCSPSWRWVAELFRSEDHTMNETTTSPTEAAEPFSGRDHADTGTTNGFTPLHSDGPRRNCMQPRVHLVIGNLSDLLQVSRLR